MFIKFSNDLFNKYKMVSYPSIMLLLILTTYKKVLLLAFYKVVKALMSTNSLAGDSPYSLDVGALLHML